MQDFKCFKTHLIQNKQTMNSLNFMLIFRMFFLRLHFTNYGTVGIEEPMGIRVLSGRSLFRSLSSNTSAVQ
ncbi:hypothetical protein Hdeb2414_s0019g00551241 [Helianthus debilis subsp. tardiflorus]